MFWFVFILIQKLYFSVGWVPWVVGESKVKAKRSTNLVKVEVEGELGNFKWNYEHIGNSKKIFSLKQIVHEIIIQICALVLQPHNLLSCISIPMLYNSNGHKCIAMASYISNHITWVLIPFHSTFRVIPQLFLNITLNCVVSSSVHNLVNETMGR